MQPGPRPRRICIRGPERSNIHIHDMGRISKWSRRRRRSTISLLLSRLGDIYGVLLFRSGVILGRRRRTYHRPTIGKLGLTTLASTAHCRCPRASITVQTTLTSWEDAVHSFILMSTLFHDLRGLPVEISQSWDWVRFADAIEPYHEWYDIPSCRSAWLTASKALRTVRAYQVFKVVGYYWNWGPGAADRVNTWRGAGGMWDRVYSSEGYIDAKALTVQLPNTYILFFQHTDRLHGPPCDEIQVP